MKLMKAPKKELPRGAKAPRKAIKVATKRVSTKPKMPKMPK